MRVACEKGVSSEVTQALWLCFLARVTHGEEPVSHSHEGVVDTASPLNVRTRARG